MTTQMQERNKDELVKHMAMSAIDCEHVLARRLILRLVEVKTEAE